MGKKTSVDDLEQVDDKLVLNEVNFFCVFQINMWPGRVLNSCKQTSQLEENYTPGVLIEIHNSI